MGLFGVIDTASADAAAPVGPVVLVLGERGESEATRQAPALQAALPKLAPGTTPVLDPKAYVDAATSGIEPSALGSLHQVDQLLAEAGASNANLDERAALLHLAQAEKVLRDALWLPGAVAFMAEVELRLGITAAQAGLSSLAEASLRRAASLDPRRTLLAAEASPALVALATRIWAEARNAPESELPIEADAPGARVFLDDVLRGTAPLLLRAASGTHVLRIEAPDRKPYGATLELERGRRPTQRVLLGHAPSADALAQLEAAARQSNEGDAQLALAALSHELPEITAAVWLERDRVSDRALIRRCTLAECAAFARIAATQLLEVSVGSGEQPALSHARAWLHQVTEPSPQPPPRVANGPSVWKHWYVWSGLAVLAVAGTTTAIALAAAPAPEHKLKIDIDPSGVR